MARQLYEDVHGAEFFDTGGGGNPNANRSSLTGNLTADLGATLGGGLPAVNLGIQSLMDILGSQGRTDPALLNRQRAVNFRNTSALQNAQAGSAARRGMQNSGVANAINAAIGAAGQDRDAGILARDAAMTEQRKRADVNQLLSFIDRLLKQSQTEAFIDESARNRSDLKDAAKKQLLANAFGGDSAKDFLDWVTNRFQNQQFDTTSTDPLFGSEEDPRYTLIF